MQKIWTIKCTLRLAAPLHIHSKSGPVSVLELYKIENWPTLEHFFSVSEMTLQLFRVLRLYVVKLSVKTELAKVFNISHEAHV